MLSPISCDCTDDMTHNKEKKTEELIVGVGGQFHDVFFDDVSVKYKRMTYSYFLPLYRLILCMFVPMGFMLC